MTFSRIATRFASLSHAGHFVLIFLGLGCVIWGGRVILWERSQVPICSQELLTEASEDHLFQEQSLTVAVDGAVKNPGVYVVPLGSRKEEAVLQAGGVAPSADRTQIARNLNFSEKLSDGEKIYIPFQEESSNQEPALKAIKDESHGKISINSGTVEELDTLPGIGEARAREIIEKRPYTDINELVEQDVLTEGIFSNLKSKITL